MVSSPIPTTNLSVPYLAGRSRETGGRIAYVLNKCAMQE